MTWAPRTKLRTAFIIAAYSLTVLIVILHGCLAVFGMLWGASPFVVVFPLVIFGWICAALILAAHYMGRSHSP